jgi:hypothetical protein
MCPLREDVLPTIKVTLPSPVPPRVPGMNLFRSQVLFFFRVQTILFKKLLRYMIRATEILGDLILASKCQEWYIQLETAAGAKQAEVNLILEKGKKYIRIVAKLKGHAPPEIVQSQ